MNKTIRFTWGKLLLVGLAIILAVSFVGKITNGFTKDWEDVTILERNPENELTGNYGWKDDVYNVGDGYKLTARKDGSIIINGKYTGSNGKAEIPLETVTLQAGTYTISGAPNGGNATYYLKATVGDTDYIANFGAEGGTFTTNGGQVTVTLVLFGDYDFSNIKIQPVIVEGSDAGDFYK